MSRASGIGGPAIGSVCLCCDIDNNGWLDSIQFTFSHRQDAIDTFCTDHGPEGGSPICFFLNNRDGTFTTIEPQLGLYECWGPRTGAVGDFNKDGYLVYSVMVIRVLTG